MLACTIAMASEDIIPVQEEEESAVCLLDRLKCPRESDLAGKRKVQTNPCKWQQQSVYFRFFLTVLMIDKHPHYTTI